MKIEAINAALDFYNISNEDYRQKCYECVESINYRKQKDIIDKICHILYDEKIASKRVQVKQIENLLQIPIHPFVTSIVVLLGYTIHENNFRNYKFNQYQIDMHKRRVREKLTTDIYERGYDGIRVGEVVFAASFINVNVIEIGRLQFEFAKLNPITNDIEDCIKIHIPRGEKLDIELVKKSISESKELINKYFGLSYYKYYCKSWLLSKQIKDIVDETSNIYKFQNLFDIIEGNECTDDILYFVYNMQDCKNYNDLPENTSLQMKVKNKLLNNTTFTLGIGTIKSQ